MAAEIYLASTDALFRRAMEEILSVEGFSCLPFGEELPEPANAVIWDADAPPNMPAPPGALTIGRHPPCDMQKPIHAHTLLALIYQATKSDIPDTRPLTGKWQFSETARQVQHRDTGQAVALTEKEAALLACLLENRGHTLTRQALLERVWGYAAELETHTLETHMYRLRSKCREIIGEENWIETTDDGYTLAL